VETLTSLFKKSRTRARTDHLARSSRTSPEANKARTRHCGRVAAHKGGKRPMTVTTSARLRRSQSNCFRETRQARSPSIEQRRRAHGTEQLCQVCRYCRLPSPATAETTPITVRSPQPGLRSIATLSVRRVSATCKAEKQRQHEAIRIRPERQLLGATEGMMPRNSKPRWSRT
jgi:hypothetical protein